MKLLNHFCFPDLKRPYVHDLRYAAFDQNPNKYPRVVRAEVLHERFFAKLYVRFIRREVLRRCKINDLRTSAQSNHDVERLGEYNEGKILLL